MALRLFLLAGGLGLGFLLLAFLLLAFLLRLALFLSHDFCISLFAQLEVGQLLSRALGFLPLLSASTVDVPLIPPRHIF